MIEYIIQAKIDSLVIGAICAYSGFKENIEATNYQDINTIFAIAIYGIMGAVVMETLKVVKAKVLSIRF